MGMGDFPAGCGPAGLDPIVATTARAKKSPPQALQYDLATRRFVQNADGSMASVHPIDQQVDLAMGIALGSLPGTPTQGNRLRRIQRAAGQTLQREVEDAVYDALNLLTTAKKITVLAVLVATPAPGQVIVQLVYVNMVTRKRLQPRFALAA